MKFRPSEADITTVRDNMLGIGCCALLTSATLLVPATVSAADFEIPVDDGDVSDLPGYVIGDVAPTNDDGPDFAYDRWHDRWGQSLADVTVGTPADVTEQHVGVLESPINTDDQFAHRLRTLFTPVESGRYRFHVAGDDDARLFFNPAGVDPVGAGLIAYVAGWTTLRQWDRFASQQSAWFELQAGTSYYLEAIGKEGSGDDHLSVGLQREDGPITIVPAELIDATDLGAGGWRTRTPHGLPDLPGSTTDPGWRVTTTTELIDLGWNVIDGAEWYQVRLEGSGQVVVVDVDEPHVEFDGLVPDSRHHVEVVPMNSAGAGAPMERVVMTDPGAYPIPVMASIADDAAPSVAYDRWDIGWWTLTSIPDGYQPWFSGTLAGGLETPPMQGEHHAARLRAVLTPTQTDDYTFHLSGDDDARLLFNPFGPTAGGATPIAYVSGWTQQYQWDRYQSQRSATFRLTAGESYYIEAIAVHAFDIDHLEVGWSRGDGPIEVVPASVLSPTLAGAGGWRRDATDLPLVPGKPQRLQVDGDTTSLHATWKAPREHPRHGPVAFYEVIVRGEGLDLSFLTDDHELVVEGLPSGGRFWFEVRPWNSSGQGKPAAHTVHTDREREADEHGAHGEHEGHDDHDERDCPDRNGPLTNAIDPGSVQPRAERSAVAPVGVFVADRATERLVSAPPMASLPPVPVAPAAVSDATSPAAVQPIPPVVEHSPEQSPAEVAPRPKHLGLVLEWRPAASPAVGGVAIATAVPVSFG